ncbi:MAG: hypothetical protein QG567_2132 [Campylobacterota bacterium]|nr:hypothetical protein [Campylobacterota bacterium]
MDIKKILDEEIKKRDSIYEVCDERPDPILVARKYKDPTISLICSLFAYGNAKMIVKFLETLDFSLLKDSEKNIKKAFSNHYYRFQKSDDVINIFLTLRRLLLEDSLENIFLKGYKKEKSVLDGIGELIAKINDLNSYDSQGYRFLISAMPNKLKPSLSSPLKRWNMFLRWMAREDNIDFGLWKSVDKSSLIIPLDTHTFSVSNKLGLLNRKQYDLKAALLLTDKLKEFDASDPVKYDFALYRIGQEKISF